MAGILDSTTLGFLLAALLLFGVVALRDYSVAVTAARSGLALFLRYAILIASCMVVASLVQTLIPRETISRHVGRGAGWRAICIGAIVGGLTPGSPYAALPLFAGFIRMGASIAAGVAMVCAWGLVSVGRVPLEAGVMGARFALIQVISSLPLPLIAGAIAGFIEARF
ncbi:MAG: permease [Ignavibacteriales bacterium]